MNNLFKELEDLGIVTDSDLRIYNKPVVKQEVKRINPSVVKEIIYQRKVECPVCDTKFMTSSVRAGRIRFVDTELDLRPVYENFDPLPYDVVACPMCGYAHLNKYFNKISDMKIGKIKEKVSLTYKGKHYPMIYTYQDALERYKMALLGCLVGLDSNGIKAYLCLKISWLYRGYQLELEEDDSHESLIYDLHQQELEFAKKAYQGFLLAYENENFPIVGIEENSMEYLIADLARRQGDFKACRKWLSRVLLKKNPKRLKQKIYQVKERMNNNRRD